MATPPPAAPDGAPEAAVPELAGAFLWHRGHPLLAYKDLPLDTRRYHPHQTTPLCQAALAMPDGSYRCTRDAGHPGPFHEAGNTERLLARWPVAP